MVFKFLSISVLSSSFLDLYWNWFILSFIRCIRKYSNLYALAFQYIAMQIYGLSYPLINSGSWGQIYGQVECHEYEYSKSIPSQFTLYFMLKLEILYNLVKIYVAINNYNLPSIHSLGLRRILYIPGPIILSCSNF